jgi:cyclohexanone monooxygenase
LIRIFEIVKYILSRQDKEDYIRKLLDLIFWTSERELNFRKNIYFKYEREKVMTKKQEFDAIIVGAGFSGMYMLHLLREKGFSVCLYEAGSNVGGTWYWNRYPGARCDVPAEFYCYTFSEEIHKEWTWSSVYPEQSEILDYCNFVATKLDLRRDIQFNTRLTSAEYDETLKKWKVSAGDGDAVYAKYFIPALGNVSIPHAPKIRGLENYQGEIYHTSRWPHEKVDFKGKRVAVIGTGSSGVQAITAISKEAEHLTVFQRTAQFVSPVKNPLLKPDQIKKIKDNFPELRRQIRGHVIGMPVFDVRRPYSALKDSPEERQKFYEVLWQEQNGFQLLFSYLDITLDDDANATLAEFVRSKIKAIVKDPETAENLLPTYLIGGKRPVVATNYYETYNQNNVSLVNLQKTSFVECTNKALRTTEGEYELDIIVFASGFDAMTGPLMKANIRGRKGVLLKDKWEGGENLKTYLGVCNVGFPNMFTITGPHFPLTANALTVNEVIAEWIFDCIQYMERDGIEEIEATAEAEDLWTDHVNEVGSQSIYAKVDSWYTGANIEGKPRGFLGYTGDYLTYQELFNDAKDYKGFTLTPQKEASVKK